VTLKNNNSTLGVVINFDDVTCYSLEKNWYGGESKVYTGKTNQVQLFPLESVTLSFARHNGSVWIFEMGTQSDVANIGLEIYSSVVPVK
jgi:hypothetical protein